MFQPVLDTEEYFNTLLPTQRLVHSAPAQLLQAATAWSKAVWTAAKRLGPMALTEEQVTDGLRLAQNPVFVCGVHRSGTTLVRDLLDNHPQLSVLPSEGTFYTNQESKLHKLPENELAAYLGTEWLRRLANPINQAPYWLLGRSAADASPYIDFARYVMAWWLVVDHAAGTQWPHTAIVLAYASVTNNLGAKYWVDKTPTNERFLERIWQEMPQARIIHVIREPLATIASRRVMEPGIGMGSILRDMETAYTTAITQTERMDPRFLLLRYENLCADPEAVTGRIGGFLNINDLPILREATVAGMPAKANSSFKNDNTVGHILNQEQQHHTDVLSATDRWQIAAYVGTLAKQLGYTLPGTGILRSVMQRVRYRVFG